MDISRCGACYRSDIKLSLCSRCKSVAYCNKEHQTADWSSHKEFCNTGKFKPKIMPATVYVLDKEVSNISSEISTAISFVKPENQQMADMELLAETPTNKMGVKNSYKSPMFMKLPKHDKCPFSIVCLIDNQFHNIRMADYNRVKRESTTTMVVSKFISFNIYRCKDNGYYLINMAYLEY